jgi:hypothetical protein
MTMTIYEVDGDWHSESEYGRTRCGKIRPVNAEMRMIGNNGSVFLPEPPNMCEKCFHANIASILDSLKQDAELLDKIQNDSSNKSN